jgi:cytochrome P450
MLHTFTPAHLRTLHPTMREYADQFVEVLSKERPIAEHNMLKYFKYIALDISEYSGPRDRPHSISFEYSCPAQLVQPRTDTPPAS